MPYPKTTWDESTAITDERLNNQEDGIGDVEAYIDGVIATAEQNIEDAKTPIAAAITAKGVTADNTMDFTTLSGKIGEINAIKSIQQGYFTVSASEAGHTKTITLVSPVNTDKSIIIAIKTSGFGASVRRTAFRFYFTSGTEITAIRSLDDDGDASGYVYTVIEFEDWVSVQSGFKSNVSSNVTISEVDTTKSFAVCSGSCSLSTTGISIGCMLVSGTEIEFKGSSGSYWSVTWYVVDLSTS